jgi:hypothetical protein
VAIDLLPDAPDPANDTPQAFSQKAAAMVLAQKAMVPQINAEIAALNAAIASFNSALAGNAYAMLYNVDLSSTADADPGAGKLRFNNATQNLATVLRADVVSADTTDYIKSLDTFDASTSTVKGTIRIVKVGDARKFLVYNVSARAAPAGYRNITVTPVDSSAANPFVNGEQVLLFFQRNGDKGDKGDQGDPGTLLAPTLHVRDERPSGTQGGVLSAHTWNVRALNTVRLNTITGASLAANRVTLPAGTYEIDAATSAWNASGLRPRLYNVTDAAVTIEGLNGNSEQSVTVYGLIKGRFTISASKTFELQLHIQSGLAETRMGGQALGGSGYTTTPEVYSEAIFRKVA